MGARGYCHRRLSTSSTSPTEQQRRTFHFSVEFIHFSVYSSNRNIIMMMMMNETRTYLISLAFPWIREQKLLDSLNANGNSVNNLHLKANHETIVKLVSFFSLILFLFLLARFTTSSRFSVSSSSSSSLLSERANIYVCFGRKVFGGLTLVWMSWAPRKMLAKMKLTYIFISIIF